MSKTTLKQRIEGLMSSTSSDQAVMACKEALKKYEEYNNFILPGHLAEQFELSVAESLIKDLESIEEGMVSDFLAVEKRIVGLNNMGVKKAIAALSESEMASNPATMYVLQSVQKVQHLPEWSIIDQVIESLKTFEWNPLVKEHLNVMKANAAKYSEDIKIYKAVDEAKASKASFVIESVEKEIDTYLNFRTSSNRAKLLESLGKYTFDQGVRKLHNVILESENTFQLKANTNDARVAKLYSPVLINEDSEVFSVFGKGYVKSGNNVRPLSEDESKMLPEYFHWMSTFLAQPNVEVSEGRVKIFSHDKKVEIVEESDNLNIHINGKVVPVDEFHKVYLNSGIFRANEREIINAVSRIVEKWNIIFELDFAKSVFPKNYGNRRVDIFKINETIHINRVDSVMNENIFHEDCNAVQAKNLVMEFAHYDLSNAFASLLSEKERELKKLEESKKQLLDTITYLEDRKTLIEGIDDEDVRESAEVKEVLEMINTEIDAVKSVYYEIHNRQKELTTVQEGLGATVGDEVEYLKKKQ